MNNLEQIAVHSLLNCEEDQNHIANWETATPIKEESYSPQPKSFHQHRKKQRVLLPKQKTHQKSSVEIYPEDDNQPNLQQKESSVQVLIDEYMKQIKETKKQMGHIYQQQFDIKSGWLKFSSIIIDDKKPFRRHNRSQIEFPLKDLSAHSQKQQIKYRQKDSPAKKIFTNNDVPFFLPKLRASLCVK